MTPVKAIRVGVGHKIITKREKNKNCPAYRRKILERKRSGFLLQVRTRVGLCKALDAEAVCLVHVTVEKLERNDQLN